MKNEKNEINKKLEEILIEKISGGIIKNIPENNTKMTFVPTKKSHAMLRLLSYKCRVSMSNIVRTALEEFLEKIPFKYDEHEDIAKFDLD